MIDPQAVRALGQIVASDEVKQALEQIASEIVRLRAALEWYADHFCEYDTHFSGCGKLSDDACSGCKARAALLPVL